MLCLDNTDTLEGGASVANVVDITVHGLVGTTFTNIAQGQLSDTDPSVLYTAGAAISVVSIILVNTHSSSVNVNLYLDPANAGTPRRLIPEDLTLAAGYSLFFDGAKSTVMDTNGSIITAAAAGAVMEADYNAHTILQATADDTPAALTVGEQTVVGRITAGNITALTATQVRTLVNVEDGADVTDTTNVTAAGALMDSEVDADIKTLVLPASTTISAFGATLVDDADAAASRSTLGLGTASTRAAEDTLTDGSNLPDGAAIKAYGDTNWAGGGGSVDTSGTPVDDDFARFTDADTIEGLSNIETKTALSLNLVENTAHSSDAHTMTIDGRDVSADGGKLDGIEALADVTDTANVTSAGALMDSEAASGTIGSSGASRIAINTINGTEPQMQMFVDGTQSSQIYSGGVVSVNAALDGTIDVSAITGYIKRSADNEAMDMGSFEISAVSGAALAAGLNYVCVDYNSGTPIVTYPTSAPNHSTVFPFAQVYKDVNDHLHILQGGHNFLGLPWKVFERFYNVEGLVRATGVITTEGTTHTHLKVSAGIFYQGLARFTFDEFDGDITETITGAGTGGTVSANNTIVLDSGEGDVTAQYEHGSEFVLDSSSNSNDGSYHVESSSWDGTNTTIVVEGTALTTGADTGHIHPHVFTYWNYTADNGWIEADQTGAHTSIHIDVDYYNDITQNQGSQFSTYVSNRYGIAWVYASSAEDSRIHVIYGQDSYTLAEAVEAAQPSSLPDIINNMGFLIARIVFQESATDFYSISYPWDTTFAATGAADHGGLAGLGDDDHPQYIKDSEYNAKGDILSATADDTPAILTVGTNDHVLTADSGEATGMKWAAASGGGVTEGEAIALIIALS